MNTYDRQPEEPEDAWTAFYRYRDIANPRPALEVFATQTGYPLTRVKGWSSRHDWAGRLCAWDQQVDGVRQGATLRGVEEMAQRHLNVAKKGIAAVEIAIDRIHMDLQQEYHRLKPHEISRLLEVCTKLERLSRGEATERIEGGTDYSSLSDEDLAELQRISSKCK